MIDLESHQWEELQDAYGPASKIPTLLKELALDPAPKKSARDETWFSLWSALYHQGDIYTASYAAVPHIIQIGHNATGELDPSFFLLPKEILVARLKGRGPEPTADLLADLCLYLPHLLKIKLALKEKTALEDDGTKTMDNRDGLCKQCGHVFDPHLVVALHEDRTKGGVLVCPEEGCTCFNTWD